LYQLNDLPIDLHQFTVVIDTVVAYQF